MPTKIKICGVTRVADAAAVAAAGADFIGLNFWPTSKRYLAPDDAPRLADAARAIGAVRVVGVFVNASLDYIIAVVARAALDVIQLHGDESPEDVLAVMQAAQRPVWKAIAATGPGDLDRLEIWPAETILLDAPAAGRGGAGKTFDWRLASEVRRQHPARPLVLAGGLDPHNVGAAIAAVDPWAVDVASGVEAAPGIKDPARIAAFVAAVRGSARP